VRRLFRLVVFAVVLTALIKLLRDLVEDAAGPMDRGETAPAAPPRPREAWEKSAARSDAGVPKGDGTAGLSKVELYEKAKELEIQGRSKMSKSELQRAVEERERG
jgi:hypothetical protein